MARQNKFHTLQRGTTAITTFNGDEFNGIVGNVITLPINFTPKSFKGYFAVTFSDSITGITIGTPTTDPCVEAYGLPWRWSTFTGCSSVSTMPLASYTHQPSTWRDTECGKRYQKRWIREPLIEPTMPLTSVNVFSSCKKSFVTWVISTNTWTVSTVVGADVKELPYTLKYTQDGSQPYTVSINQDTPFKIQACQPITCEQVVNSITLYVDQVSMPEIYNDLVAALNTTIRPRFANYLLTNGHTVGDLNELVQIKPIVGKRYFNDLASTGFVPLTGNGNTNVSLVFIDIPSAYITCTNPSRTTSFENDFGVFTNMLTGVHEETYKLTIFTVTSGSTTSNICPASQQFHDALVTGTNGNYPAPYNFAYRNTHLITENNILYKNSVMPNAAATSVYYTNLILNNLLRHNIDLINFVPFRPQKTLCDSVSAVIESAPQIRVYTANRFVPLNSLVKFQNVSLRLDKIVSITIDFDDGIIQTYTGSGVYEDFYVVYTLPGYKTLKITFTTTTGAFRTQTFNKIVNVVSFYD